MKKNIISKTYRVEVLTAKKIEEFAKEKSVSQGRAINDLIKLAIRYIDESQLEKELNDLSKDTEWLKENEEWAELDLS